MNSNFPPEKSPVPSIEQDPYNLRPYEKPSPVEPSHLKETKGPTPHDVAGPITDPGANGLHPAVQRG